MIGTGGSVRPGFRDIYGAVSGITYNYQQNQRYLAHDDGDSRLALEFRLQYSVAQVLFGYFTIRYIPWQGEKKAIQYWKVHDRNYLALFIKYHRTVGLEERFAIYAEMAHKALEPLGGMWPAQAVTVSLEGQDWTQEDLETAVDFWHSLVT